MTEDTVDRLIHELRRLGWNIEDRNDLDRALREAGLAVVPVEATIDMSLAGAHQVNRHMRGPGAPADYDAAQDAYRAMVRAAGGEQ